MYQAHFHQEHPVLEITFFGDIDRNDLMSAFSCYADPRFTLSHHVIFDMTNGRIAFDLGDMAHAIEAIGSGMRGVGTRTAIVSSSGLLRGVLGSARSLRGRWATSWKFFAQREPAFRWLLMPGEEPPDFAAEVDPEP